MSFGSELRSRAPWGWVLAGLAAVAGSAQAQVSLTTLGTPYTQNFDSLLTSGTANPWTDNTTIPGWYAQFSATPANPTTYRADSGGSNTGAIYSWGQAGVNPLTERGFGMVASGTPVTVLSAVRFVNNTGAPISSLQVSYNGEQWRDGGAVTPVAQTTFFEYQVGNAGAITDANAPSTGWTSVSSLDFTSPTFTNTGAGVAIEGNQPANRTAKSAMVTVTVNPGQEIWLRWRDPNDTGNDHGLGIDDLSVTPQGAANQPVVPTCPASLTTTTGTATSGGVSASDADGTVTSATITSITPSNPGTITLTGFTPAGGVGGTANATLDVSATTPLGAYSVTLQWANNDGVPQTANCVVGVTVNTIAFIHDIQGNGAATPIPGATVTLEGVVTGDFQPITNDNRLSGFFVQEEDVDFDADPNTSEAIFVFCSACPTNVAEGQKVQVTGTVSEFNNLTLITATTAGSVVITNAGNNLAQVSASSVDLPVVGVIDDFYEPRENMLVTFVDTLTVSEYFEQARYGRIELFEGSRPRAFNESNPPSVAGFAAHNDNLNRRRVFLDDDDNVENSVLNLPDGQQFVFHPQANGGLSVGTQGADFFRGGDLVSGLTGILHFSFSGGASPDEWRVRPVAASPAAFTVANARPAAPPVVGGSIRAASVDALNYFTTLDVLGADSVAELNRQRERTSIVLCSLNADVAALTGIENHATNATITDLLGDVNTRCGGAHPYTFVNTGGALGMDLTRVLLIYRTGVVSPVGAPLSDLDPVHTRPPTAQTFDVVDALNPAFGQRFTALANHAKSKGCGGAAGADLDQADGQGCFAATRLAQANRILTWVNGTVIPAAGDPDVLMLGDFSAYPQETSAATIAGAGFSDLENAFLGAAAYSFLFAGQTGHIDYAWSSASLTPQVIGAATWHINADENPLFDYNDEIDDGAAEAAFEEKPDGSALAPPRVLFQPASAVRASDHDPVLLGLFAISDLVVTKTDSPDPVNAGANLTYTVTVSNNGPDAASNASWSDTLPAGTTFVSLSAVAGWSCTTPAVGAGGTVSCSNPSFAVGSAVFTLTVNVDASVAAGTVLSNTATATSATAEGNPGDESDTETTTVAASADLQLSKTDSPDPVVAGANLTYQITLTNNGPSNAASASFSDTLPAGTTFVSLSTTGPWSCTTPAVGAGGTVSCTNPSFGVTVDFFTLVVNVDPSVAAGTVLSNTATIASATADPNSGNESDTATTTVTASADLQISKTDTPDPVNAGDNLTYQITITNNGPSNAASASFSDTLPAGTTFVSLSTTGSWSCATPAVGATGTVSCTNASFGATVDFFTLVVNVDAGVASGTVLSNTATLVSATADPDGSNNSDTATSTVGAGSADLSLTKTETPDPVAPGTNLTYTITVNNAGPSVATTVALADTVPANTTFVSLAAPGGWSCTTPAVGGTGNIDCSNASVAPGAAVFTLVVNVNAGVVGGTVLSNTATIASATSDPNAGNNSATATTTVGVGSADVSVTKTDTPDPISAGSLLTYTITVANAGPSDAANVTMTDTVPAGTVFINLSSPAGWSCATPGVGGTGTINCSIASLAVGTNAVFTLLATVDSGLPTGTIITNTAAVASSTSDPNAANNSATTTTTVAPVTNFTVTKSVAGTFVSGSNVTYTVTLTNNMGHTQGNNFANEFADILPAGLALTGATASSGTILTVLPSNIVTWNGSIPNGGSVTITITATITATSGTISNQGNAIIDTDNSGTNESAVFSDDPSTAAPNDPTVFTVVESADLSVTKTGTPDPVSPGTNLTYTITVNNAGPSAASNATLSDTLPVGTTFVSLTSAAGWSCTAPAVGGTGSVNCSIASLGSGNSVFTLVVAVDAGVAGGTMIGNTATVASTTSDPTPANNSATATTTVGTGSADLSVTKTAAPNPVAAGGNLTYTITANNLGPSAATNFVLSDTLPAGTTFVSLTAAAGYTCTTPSVGASGTVSCTRASMPVGSGAFTLVVQVGAAATGGAVISNTATVSSATTDPVPGNNSATATSTVSAPAVVSGTKAVGAAAAPGGTATYTIVLSNTGAGTQGDNVGDEFTDVLPSSLILVSASATSGTAVANVGTNTVTWNGSIAAGGTVTITIQATVAANVAPGTSIMNQGTIRFDADGNGSNEATAVTDNPGTGTAGDGTGFIVAQGVLAPQVIPTTSLPINLLLAAMLALIAFVGLRRRAG